MDKIKKSKKSTCGLKCDIYSRIVGYMTPIENWNKGKQEEFKERKPFSFNIKFTKSSKKVTFDENGEPSIENI